MFKKIALAAVAATLIAGPAFASDQMAAPTSKPSVSASDTATKSITKKHKKHKKDLHKKNMKKTTTTTKAP